MEENVALDSTKQKTFVKSIRGIKKILKKNEKKKAKSEPSKKDEEVKPKKPFSMRLKSGQIKKKKRKERGLVYLSHIPHGFYEHQMTQYFKQFGVVTNARVIKSKRTGNSKGFAFVEFKDPSVAQIVAETMNNYLMGKRLIKAVYIPPEKQKRRAFRKHWNAVHNPTSIKRLKLKKEFNADKNDAQELIKAKKLLNTLSKTKKRLNDMGINYDFFTPVDVPEVLLNRVIKQEKEDDDTVKDESKIKSKKDKKEKVEKKEEKNVAEKVKVEKNVAKNVKVDKNAPKNVKVEKIIEKNNKGQNQKANKKENKPNEVSKKGKQEEKKETVAKENKKDNKQVKVNQKQQKDKEQKLKDAGVKPVEDFISLEGEDSDASYEFDSDEYEKMIGEDDEFSSGESEEESGADEESGDEQDIDDDESVEEDQPPAPKKAKGKPPPKVAQPVQTKTQGKKQQPQNPQVNKQQPQKPQGKKQQPQKPQGKKQQPQKPQGKKQEQKPQNDVKRKTPQKPVAAGKKPKFEKQNQKPMKKQFKKK